MTDQHGRHSVDEDLEGRAIALDREALQWKSRETWSWLLVVLVTIGSVVAIIADSPTILSLCGGLLIGYVLSQAQTARRRRRKAVAESARLRGLAGGKHVVP